METVPEGARDPRVALYDEPRDPAEAGEDGKAPEETDGKAAEADAEEDAGTDADREADGNTGGDEDRADGSGDSGEPEEPEGAADADGGDTAGGGNQAEEAEEAGAGDAEDGADDVTGAAEEDEEGAEESGTDGGEDGTGSEAGAEPPADRATTFLRVPADEKAGTSEDEDGSEDGGDGGGAEAPEDTEDAEKAGEAGGKPGSGQPVDQTTKIFRVPGSRAEVQAGTGPEGDRNAEGAEKTEKPEKAGKAEGTGDGAGRKAGAAAPVADSVDQPTAMFRAVVPPEAPQRPGRPEGDRPRGKAEGKAAGKAGGSEESDAERTSRFVPLKSADEPRVPAASASAAATGQLPRPELPESERTKQQPLPPHKPLELLAELTNKPAPPETPLRVALRRVKIWSPLVLLLVIVLAVAQLLRPLPEPELTLTAPATYTFGGEKPALDWPSEGQAVLEVEGLGSLGSYGEQHKPVPIASVAKVMTAYVILRDHPLKAGEEGPAIPVDEQAEKDAGLSSQGESTVEVKAGEKITLNEALHALMIASANNVARLLARWDSGGSEEAFVKKMNDAAKELGMADTTYTDPSGLRKETVSTPADQVKLGKKVMDFEVFREIVKKPSYEDRNGKQHRNWNGLVPYNGAVGIKTGTSTAAGGNLLFAGEKEIGGTRQLIIGAVLGQYKPAIIDTVISESRELLVSGQEVLKAEKIVRKGDVVGHLDDGLGGRTPLVATQDVTAVGWSGLKVELALSDGGKGVPHEAEAGRTVGVLTVGSGPGQVKVPVAVQRELAEPSTGTRLTRIL